MIFVKRTDTNEYEATSSDEGPKWDIHTERAHPWSELEIAEAQAADYRALGVPAVVVVE